MTESKTDSANYQDRLNLAGLPHETCNRRLDDFYADRFEQLSGVRIAAADVKDSPPLNEAEQALLDQLSDFLSPSSQVRERQVLSILNQ